MKILIAWEVGDGHGHLRNIAALANHEAIASQDVIAMVPAAYAKQARAMMPRAKVSVGPTPRPQFDQRRARVFTDILAAMATDDMSCWLNARADILVAESAPRAVTALSGKIPTIAFGTPYGIAPDAPESAPMAFVKPEDEGYPYAPPCKAADRSVPLCYPLLDPYKREGHAGPLHRYERLPEGNGTFAYLDWNYPGLQRVLDQLPADVRVHIKNGPSPLGEFDLLDELRRADYVVHHGSQGIAHACLDTGRGQLCLPWHRENEITGMALATANYGHVLGAGEIERMPEAFRVRGRCLDKLGASGEWVGIEAVVAAVVTRTAMATLSA
jgi:hypothetical protein